MTDGLRLGLELTPLARGATGIATYVGGLLGRRAALGAEELVGLVNVPGLRRVRLPGLDGSPPVRVVRSRVPRRILNRSWLGRGVGGVEDLLGPIDVFHATDLVAPRARSAAIVLTVHDLAWRRDPSLGDPALLPFLTRWFEPSLAAADRIVVPSRATARDLAKHFSVPGDRVAVVAHGIDERFGPGDDGDAGVLERAGLPAGAVAFVGALDRRKDVASLVAAHALLRDRGRSLPLVIAGPDAGGRARVEEAIAGAGLADGVHLPGRVEPAVVPALFRSAAVVAYPSRWEGFGLPVLEALACGARVVASRIPAIEEVAGNAARLVHPGDPVALARELERALDEDGGEARGRGLARAREHTWERAARETRAAYDEALRTRAAGAGRCASS